MPRPDPDPPRPSDEPYDAVVIGAGQSGLASGYHLRRAGLRFLICEAGDEPAGSWPNHYDSLRLFSAARYCTLPGLDFPGDPDHLPVRDEVVSYLKRYAAAHGLPVRPRTRVHAVERDGRGFRVSAPGFTTHADAVIVATGACSTPYEPPIPGRDAFRGRVIHSSAYRRPDSVHGPSVVVVGGGNSAVQIARELADSARVTLALRSPVRLLPHRVLGRDLHFWLRWSGADRCAFLRGGSMPVIDTGGYTEFIRSDRLRRRVMFERFTDRGVAWAGGEEPADTVILATGFRESFPFLSGLPGADAHRRGVSATVDGLYFVGRPGQNGIASGTMRGAGRDARLIVRRLAARAERLGRVHRSK